MATARRVLNAYTARALYYSQHSIQRRSAPADFGSFKKLTYLLGRALHAPKGRVQRWSLWETQSETAFFTLIRKFWPNDIATMIGTAIFPLDPHAAHVMNGI